jgi:hypothetical protein
MTRDTDDDTLTSTDPKHSNPARFGIAEGEIEMLGKPKGATRSLTTPEEDADNAKHDAAIATAREQPDDGEDA